MNEEFVNVCLSANDAWAPFAAVTINSILENTKEAVHFFVLNAELTEENKSRLNLTVKKFENAKLEYVSVINENLKEFKTAIDYISQDTFFKILFPILRKDISRVIYTDVDVVFKDDIKNLFDEDLDGNILGAVRGISHADGKDNVRLQLNEKHNYFQAGLLLIDCEKWRNENITATCYDVLKRNKLRYGDQDLLNIVFENRYKELHQKYCVIPFQLDEMKTFSEDSRDALRNSFIIHYAGGNKPWITSGALENNFWRYAAETDFFVDIIKMRLGNDFVSKERSIDIKQYNLFGKLPLLKVKRKFSYTKITERYYLFNFLPILKKVDSTNTIKWTSFFKFPILHLRKY